MTFAAEEADRAHLRRCLELAERGRGSVSPNPMVGAVLVRDGELIGEGWHAELGGPHAEVAALADARGRGNDPAGATMYVSLEPCAHQGRQPPCADAIREAGLARVVIAAEDPSSKAAGKGPRLLREAGIEVGVANGDEAVAARLQNQAFRKHARTGKPLVALKSALSLDGFTATQGGDSKWISSPASRALVHGWRAECDAVAVGIGTALADDPLLTARDVDPPPARQPARVVFDSHARLPLDSRLIASSGEARLIVFCDAGAEPARVEALGEAGVQVVAVEGEPEARVSAALTALGGGEITSILLEGGATLAGAFASAGEIDELRLFYAPLLLGGGRPLVAGAGASTVAEGLRPGAVEWRQIDGDMLMRARLREW